MRTMRKLFYSAPLIEAEQEARMAGMLCASVDDGAIEGLEIEDLVFGEEGEI